MNKNKGSHGNMRVFCYEIGGDDLQEDIEHRSITLAINATKLTGRVLKSAITKYLAHL